MTLESKMYGPPWVVCATCGVTQPLASLEYSTGRVPIEQLGTAPKSWRCKDMAKCAAGKLDRDVELAKFDRQHPLLKVRR